MAKFIFRLDKIHVNNVRDKDFDRDVVMFGVQVGLNRFGPLTGDIFGTVRSGATALFSGPNALTPSGGADKWEIGPIEIGEADEVTIVYSVINTGNLPAPLSPKDQAEMGAAVFGAVVSAIDPIVGIAATVIGEFLSGLVHERHCEGPVLVERENFTGAQLLSDLAAAGGTELHLVRAHLTVPSPAECGHPPDTDVEFSIIRARAESTPSAAQGRNLIQSNFGFQGNFELVVPLGNHLAHYFRDNDAPGLPWHGPFVFFDSTSHSKPGGGVAPMPVKPTAVSLLQSNFVTPGNLELIVRLSPTLGEDKLVFFFRDAAGWHGPFDIVADGKPIAGVTGF